MRETELYPPMKAFLEAQGYAVRGEVETCDLVAVRGDEAPVFVEIKTSFTLGLARIFSVRRARRVLSVGEIPTRQLSFQPVAIGTVVEVTKRLKLPV